MAWACLHLANNPSVQTNLFEEVQRELADSEPDFENIKKLKYTHNVIKETLRISPTLPLTARAAPTTQIINGYVIPAGV